MPDQVVVFQTAFELMEHPALTRIAAFVDMAQALGKQRQGYASKSAFKQIANGSRCISIAPHTNVSSTVAYP